MYRTSDIKNDKVRKGNSKRTEVKFPAMGLLKTDMYCCYRRAISEQEDFKQQNEWLEEIVADQNSCRLIFFPRFHCELNYIEME